VREQLLGGLNAIVTGGRDREGGGDGPVVVLLHGFGAPGDDLVGLWRALDVPEEMRFVFPAAPMRPPGLGGGRAWWMIDLERLMGSSEPLDRSGEVPEGLAEARAQLIALLDDVERRLGARTIVLGGFSQGAMLALDTALRGERPFAGLVLMSGTLLAEHEWAPLMPRRRGLPVFMSHGTRDPLLPFRAAERLRDLLVEAGLKVEWVPFNGQHEIPWLVVERLGAFLRSVTAS